MPIVHLSRWGMGCWHVCIFIWEITKNALENAVISLQNNSTLMSLFPYKVVDRDKYIGRIDVPDGDENPENIYIRLAPLDFWI